MVSEITWVRALVFELQIHQTRPPDIWCDNSSVVQFSTNPMLHARAKYVELDLYFVHEKVAQGLLWVKHLPAIEKIADMFTKPLYGSAFVSLCRKFTVSDS